MSTNTALPLRRRTRLAAAAAAIVLAAGGILTASALPAHATTPACTNSALAVTPTFTQGAAGHSYMSVIYRNATHSACTLRGYAVIAAVNSTGHVIAHAGHATGYTVTTVIVPAGGYASSAVSWMNFNPVTSGPCTWSHSIDITPPNTTLVVPRPVSVSVCDLLVRPVVAGVPSYPGYAPAQLAWIRGSHAISANQGLYWQAAINALQAGSATGWAPQIAELHQLISLPDAMQTPTQHAEWLADVHSLDTFFVTPGLYL
ncbi:MAG TPA: DUF4232 domain-containing protein [Microbacterium sp.]|uniref:DUF4232 domain-containing protein n=1 Tax=Microbacterium sp. TaxID=51671 RepID=UPI002B4A25A5|nr:DUF4232 domain-containing protein [Microbacterium sp.]HKT58193.1 DUF4232 domain-containing protein [Microbacterium sp.]